MASVLLRITTNISEAYQTGTNLVSAAYGEFSKTSVGKIVAPVLNKANDMISNSLDKRSLFIGGASVYTVSFIRKMRNTPEYYLNRALVKGPDNADYKNDINNAKRRL